jgi:4-hydroxy-tetrahydrodipicolinate reductase
MLNEYAGMNAVEILNYYRNCHYADGSNTESGILANAINETLDNSRHYVYDRHSQRKKRDKNEIGMHAIRGGTIVGEHDVIFAGHDEVITLSHSASSKSVFAEGSINAAVYLVGKEPGLYDMANLVN